MPGRTAAHPLRVRRSHEPEHEPQRDIEVIGADTATYHGDLHGDSTMTFTYDNPESEPKMPNDQTDNPSQHPLPPETPYEPESDVPAPEPAPAPAPAPAPTDVPLENLVEPRLGPGGELHGDAITTPPDHLIDYPEDQDGVEVSPATTAPIPPAPLEEPVNQPENPLPSIDPAQSTTEATHPTDVGNPNDPATDTGLTGSGGSAAKSTGV